MTDTGSDSADRSNEKGPSLLESQLTPALLRDIRGFWFEHLRHDDDTILLQQEHAKKWFFGGDEFDSICVKRFRPALEAIRDAGIRSGHDLLSIVKPNDSLDWLSLVLLLDQMPRNCYRGPASKVVFTLFDPLARQVVLAALEKGIPDQTPELRWRFAYRFWFYLPLMHSEEVSVHERAMEGYSLLEKDVLELVNSDQEPTDEDEYRFKARKVVQEKPDAATAFVKMHIGIEKDHFDIIKEFGRYPHRNEAMGREPTQAERDYLQNGGKTFSASQNQDQS